MPQSSYEYAVARIRVHEKDLIGTDRMMRMAEGTLDDAMRLLNETGYGDIADATASDVEAMIAAEQQNAARLIDEISPLPAVTDLFLMRADVHNLKVLIKARLMGGTEMPTLSTGGRFNPHELSGMVQSQDYRKLPVSFRGALNALEKDLLGHVEPQMVSIAIDRAYLQHAFRVLKDTPNAFASDYFTALADFDNVLSMLRVRAMNAGKEELAAVLLPEGDLMHATLLVCLDQPFESLSKLVNKCGAGTAIVRGLEAVQRTGIVSAMEKARDDYLLRFARDGRFGMSDIRPIVGYLLARDREAKAIRLIMTAKRNGLQDSVITERLRELYG